MTIDLDRNLLAISVSCIALYVCKINQQTETSRLQQITTERTKHVGILLLILAGIVLTIVSIRRGDTPTVVIGASLIAVGSSLILLLRHERETRAQSDSPDHVRTKND